MSAHRGKVKQLELDLPRGRGGRRKGAGRKPKGARPGVSHARRPALASRFPVHVGLTVDPGLPNLRSKKTMQRLRRVFFLGNRAPGFRLVHFSVQRHHLHLIVEARSKAALSRGMQGLAIRAAKALNRLQGRRGRVFSDRYFSRILRTPQEVKRCLNYVLQNGLKHYGQKGRVVDPGWLDPCSSAEYFDGWWGNRWRPPEEREPPVEPARTWLLRKGWRRHGLLRWTSPCRCRRDRRHGPEATAKK